MRRTALALLAGLPLAAHAPMAFADEAPLEVVASFSILADMVREIGGDHVALTTLVGPDGDAHVYEPTPADARKIAAADLLVINGLGFENWLPRLLDASGFQGETVVASAGVPPRSFGAAPDEDGHDGHDDHHDDHAGHEDHDDHAGHDGEHADHDEHHAGHEGHDHGPEDPHAWQDLANGVAYARAIGAGLAEADPGNADAYREATEAYVARLQALDSEIKARFSAIPAERRRVVTTHDAFGYFGDAYGITFIAPLGTSTEAEASAADVARIIDQVREQRVTAVFVENISNTRLSDQIARETGAVVGGALYSDALSGPDGNAPTYERMFAWNVDQLSRAMTEN
nr:metal ABC transporter substrate-binding protein [Geminicoccus roseus]